MAAAVIPPHQGGRMEMDYGDQRVPASRKPAEVTRTKGAWVETLSVDANMLY